MTAASSHESPATTLRYRVGDIVRYVGSDARWVGQQGPVTRADYDGHTDVPLVVDLPGGPKGIGVCFAESNVEMVTPATLTLTDFLLARIEEDEEGARIHPREWWSTRLEVECKAKRRIVARHSVCDDVSYGDASSCPDMRDLARIYADHEDCRQEWWA